MHRLVLFMLVAFAATTAAQAPVPPALVSGRTVYLAPATDLKALDEVAKQIRGWKRVALVDAEAKADLVVTLTAAAANSGVAVPIGGILFAAGDETWTLAITDRATGARVYADLEPIGLSRYGGLKKLVQRWRQRVEHAPPAQ